MGDRPLVSIITASLNNLPGLKQTAESIASQTFRDFEHIVIDGGSTDGTVEWLASSPYPINWLSEPDQGIAEALNKGLGRSAGEWILVLHADDSFVDAASLANVVPYLSSNGDIVSSDVYFVTSRGRSRWRSRGRTWKSNFKTTIPHQGALVHRSVFHKIGNFAESYQIALDYDFFLRAHRRGVSVALTSLTLSLMPDSGLSSRLDWPSLRARFAEERRVHAAHCPHLGWQVLYGIYWPAYLSYRRFRSWVGDS